MSSSTKIDNRKRDILIFSKGPTQGLEPKLSAERMYLINLSESNTKFCLSMHYNGGNNYLFANDHEIHKFKAKDSETVSNILCIGNAPEYFSANNMKKNRIRWLCL